MTGLAGRISVNPAVVTDPTKLSVYNTSPPTPTGDTTRSDFLFTQLTSATFSYSPSTGLGSAAQPFKGSVSSYLQQFLSLQGNAATQATQLQQGQSVVVSTLQAEVQLHRQRQHRHRDGEPDPAAEFLCRQCSRHVGGAEHDAIACCRLKRSKGVEICRSAASITVRPCSAPVRAEHQQAAGGPVDAALDRQEVAELFRHGHQRGLCHRRALAARQHRRLHRHDDQRQVRSSTSPTPRCSR